MKIVFEFLDRLAVPYNKQTVRNFFDTHPYHPSLVSISDLADAFAIENAGVQIEKENFPRIPVPFIAKTQSSEGDYCLVTAMTKDNITYLNEQDKWIHASLDQFFLQYSGVVLVAEKGPASGEPDYETIRNKYRKKNNTLIAAIGFLFFILLASLLLQPGFAWVSLPLFLLKAAGTATCILLLLQSHDANNPFIHKLCSSGSGKGCDHILSSSASKIFKGTISWSEVGFFYFAGTLVALSLANGPAMLALLTLLTMLALPYTLYSIYYQVTIAKAWCRLCLTVQAILWLELLTTIFWVSFTDSLPVYGVPLMIVAGVTLSLCALWIVLKPFIDNNRQIPKLQRDINLFKKDENIFYTLLQQQREVAPMEQQYQIVFGNPGAAFKISFVSNPFCMPCAKMHQQLQHLLNECRDDLALNIIYTASHDADDPKNKVIRNLIAINDRDGKDACEKAMHDWYSNGITDPKAWFARYSTGAENARVAAIFEAHRLWCEENDITHTPALFFNNRLHLPEYNFDDVQYFIQQSAKVTYTPGHEG